MSWYEICQKHDTGRADSMAPPGTPDYNRAGGAASQSR